MGKPNIALRLFFALWTCNESVHWTSPYSRKELDFTMTLHFPKNTGGWMEPPSKTVTSSQWHVDPSAHPLQRAEKLILAFIDNAIWLTHSKGTEVNFLIAVKGIFFQHRGVNFRDNQHYSPWYSLMCFPPKHVMILSRRFHTSRYWFCSGDVSYWFIQAWGASYKTAQSWDKSP